MPRGYRGTGFPVLSDLSRRFAGTLTAPGAVRGVGLPHKASGPCSVGLLPSNAGWLAEVLADFRLTSLGSPILRRVDDVVTAIGEVRGGEGFFHYRQYGGVDVARHCSFAQAAALLLDGSFASAADIAASLGTARVVPSEVSVAGPPMAALRSSLSLFGATVDLQPVLDLGAGRRRADVLRVCGAVPSLVAASWRSTSGLPVLDADPDLDPATDYLRMLTGDVPDPAIARLLEQYLVVTMDHGFNASTYTARVVVSTGADVAAAVVAAVGSLSGPLHGGAPARALDLLDAAGTPDGAEAVVRSVVEGGGRVMGFGHRLYRTDDPRAVFLREAALAAGAARAPVAAAVEDAVVRVLAELKPGRRLYANVEFWAGVVMEHCGLPRELFAPTFAVSRAIGWGAHILEQTATGRLIRPAAVYEGPIAPQPIPEDRSR